MSFTKYAFSFFLSEKTSLFKKKKKIAQKNKLLKKKKKLLKKKIKIRSNFFLTQNLFIKKLNNKLNLVND